MLVLRSAGIGGGFAIVAALMLGGIVWWSNKPKPWSSTSVTAKPTQLMMQQVGEELRFEFRYAFTNHTSAEYALPSPELGVLMRRLPKDGSFEKMDGATWDSTIRIPPNQSIGVAFLVPYRLSDFNMSSADIDSDTKLAAFAGRRLQAIDGMAFFDFASKYKVEMARNWDDPKGPEKK
jgi:hypothetical protein